MKLDPRVRLRGVRPELVLGLMVCERVALDMGVKRLYIRSVTDGEHMRASKHYTGCAADLRVHNWGTVENQRAIVTEMRECLGSEYDILLEAAGQPNAHCHIEVDPKVPA